MLAIMITIADADKFAATRNERNYAPGEVTTAAVNGRSTVSAVATAASRAGSSEIGSNHTHAY